MLRRKLFRDMRQNAMQFIALMGERIGVDITNMIYDTAASVVADAREVMDYEGLQMDVMQVFAMEVPFTEEEFRATRENVLADKLAEEALETFKRRMDTLQKVAYPVIKKVYEERGAMYENILVPISDGKRAYNVAVNLKAAYETECREVVRSGVPHRRHTRAAGRVRR